MDNNSNNTSWDITRRTFNVIAYVVLMGGNAYNFCSNGLTIWTQPDTYFTPSTWFFAIWGVIHLGLFCFIIFQFFGGRSIEKQIIHWRFIFLTGFNATWTAFWLNEKYIPSLVMMIHVSVIVSWIYYDLKRYQGSNSLQEKLFVHLPFCLWHAFSTFIVILNVFAAFTPERSQDSPKILYTILVIIGLIFLHSIIHGYLYLGKGDILSSFVLTLAFFAIFQHQSEAIIIRWVSFVLGVISTIAIGRSFVESGPEMNEAVTDEERAPLIA